LSDRLKEIRRAAMDLLARREHSEAELFRKLAKKGFAEEMIQQIIHLFTQEKWLSNDRFVESYIHSRRKKGFGPLRIQAELIERGIHQELIDHHVKITDNAWFAVVREAWQKRFKNILPEDFKTRAQHMRFLYSRGFTSGQIESIFKHDFDN
jgi:regulatory protein